MGFLKGIRKYKVRGLMGLEGASRGLGLPEACVCRPYLLGAHSMPSLCQPQWGPEENMSTFQVK